MQDFQIYAYILPLENYDLIIVTQWLITLRDIFWNFKDLRMEFIQGGRQSCFRES